MALGLGVIGIGVGLWPGVSAATTARAVAKDPSSNAPGPGPQPNLGDYERSVTVELEAPSSTIRWDFQASVEPQGCVYGLSTTPRRGSISEGTTKIVFKWTVDNSFSFPSGGCAFHASIVEFGATLDREPPTPGGAGFGGRWAKDPGRSPNVSCFEHQLIQGTAKCRVISDDKMTFEWSANARVVSP